MRGGRTARQSRVMQVEREAWAEVKCAEYTYKFGEAKFLGTQGERDVMSEGMQGVQNEG